MIGETAYPLIIQSYSTNIKKNSFEMFVFNYNIFLVEVEKVVCSPIFEFKLKVFSNTIFFTRKLIQFL